MESKTKAAIRWMNESADRTQYAAAKIFNVSQSAISVAMQKQTKNVHLWGKHGPAIEAKESTGDFSHVAYIGTSEMIGALRGRDVLKQLSGRSAMTVEYPLTRTDDALDLIDAEGFSVREAAERCGVSAPAVYASRRVRDARARALNSVGADVCNQIEKYIAEHPTECLGDVASNFDLSIATMREAMTARATAARCALAARKPRGYDEGFAAALAQSAMLAETIGGEFGVHVAAAIRGLA